MFNDKDMIELDEVLADKVVWDKEKHRHMLGKTVLTNKEMHRMCIMYYRTEYVLLPRSEQRKVRERIFYKLRYGKNDD